MSEAAANSKEIKGVKVSKTILPENKIMKVNLLNMR